MVKSWPELIGSGNPEAHDYGAGGREDKVAYTVSITAAKGSPVNLDVAYRGPDYQAAFDAAVQARGRAEWRGKWIRFEDNDLGVVKWAQIL